MVGAEAQGAAPAGQVRLMCVCVCVCVHTRCADLCCDLEVAVEAWKAQDAEVDGQVLWGALRAHTLAA